MSSSTRHSEQRAAVFLKLTIKEWAQFVAITKHMGWPTIQDALRVLVADKIAETNQDPEQIELETIRLIKQHGFKKVQRQMRSSLVEASRTSPWNPKNRSLKE